MPPKRKASKAGTSQKGDKQPKQDGQQTVAKKINVPVDEGFQEGKSPKVHIAADGTIYDASLNQTNVGNNNNKFYRIQLIEDNGQFWTFNRWGRLGEFGQRASVGPKDFETVVKEFEKKFKDKTGLKWENRGDEPKAKKYTYIERNYEDDSEQEGEDKKDEEVKQEEEEEQEDAEPEPDSKLDERVRSLVELIFNQDNMNSTLLEMGYNAEKLPLGKLGKNTLLKGFEYLQALDEVITDASQAQSKHSMSQKDAIEHFTNRYYSTIPHIGLNKRAALPLINTADAVKREVDMLDSLTSMGITNEIMQETRNRKKQEKKKEKVARVDQQFQQLKLDEAEPLETESDEYKKLESYMINTAGHTHNGNLNIKEIFRIDRNGEEGRFADAYGKYDRTDRRLLWHGSRTSNYGGILSQGLRIAPPEAPVSGYMFGKGIYLADISTKSANYCYGGSGSDMLIMVCEAELGNKRLELFDSDYNAGDKCKEQDLLSTHGQGQTIPAAWVDAAAVHESLQGVQMPDPDKKPKINGGPQGSWLQYNEYIVYDVAQVRIRYLMRFSYN